MDYTHWLLPFVTIWPHVYAIVRIMVQKKKGIKYLYIIFYLSYNAVQIVSNILYTEVNKDYDRSCVPRTQAGSAPSRRPPLPPFLSGLLTGTNHKCPRMSRHQAASVSFTHI